MEFTGTVDPEGTIFESWADEGQVAYYEDEGDRVAEEVIAWGTASDGTRVALSWNVYGSEDALEVLEAERGRFRLVGFGNIYVDGEGGLISFSQRRRPTGRTARPDQPDSRKATAYHEAGHAVLAHTLGFEVISVSLGEELTGSTEFVLHGATNEALIVQLAGEIAGCRYRGDDRPRGGTQDVLMAAEIGTALVEQEGYGAAAPGLRIQKLIEQADADARRLVEENWPFITSVAEALVAQDSLDGGQIRGLLH